MARATPLRGARMAPPPRTTLERHSLRQNAIAMFAGQTITWTLTALTLALLPRYLGPSHMGALGISLSFSNLASTVAGLGIATLVTKDIARDHEAASRMLGTAIWLNVMLGLAAAAISIAAGQALGYAPMTQWAILVNCGIVPLNLLTLLGFAALQGAEVMRHQAIWDATNKLLFLAGTAAIIVLDLGFGAYLLLSIASAVLVTVPAIRLMHRVLPFKPWTFSIAQARYLVVASLPFSTTSVFVVVYLAVDTLLLSLLSGETAVGIYTAPSRIFGTLLFAPTIVTTVVFPRMAATYRDGAADTARLARATLALVIGITLPVAVMTVGVGDEGLVWLIGRGFADSGPVVVLLALSLVPTSVNMVAHRILIAVDRQRVWTVVVLVALVAKVAVGLVLIPLFDHAFASAALGAAASLLAVEGGMMLVAFYYMPRGIMDRAAFALYARLSAGALFATAAMLLTRPLGFFLTGIAGTLGYGAIVFLLHAYTPSQVIAGARWLAGRGAPPPAGMPAAELGLPRPERYEPLLYSPARLKGIRSARRPASRAG
ncbi:MAG: flippase [Dehalococcoidia bacterium]